MLVFISDLHLSDGSSFETINPEAFRVFAEDLVWMVGQACRRQDGRVEALERVDLVLLGDVCDPLRSKLWAQAEANPKGLRPWSPEMEDADLAGDRHAELGALVTELTRGIVENNAGGEDSEGAGAKGLACLRRLAREGIRPEGLPGERAIPLKIWYLAGNHDWFYYVDHPAYVPARALLVEAFGLAQDPAKPFPHRLEQAPAELRTIFERHQVWAQHGDLYDKDNFQVGLDDPKTAPAPGQGARARSSIGDFIVIELINRLPDAIIASFVDEGDPLADDPEFREALDEIDNVRPMQAIPQWLLSVLERFASDNDERNKDRRRWVSKAVHERLVECRREHADFLKELDHWGWDTTETLQAGTLLSAFASLKLLARASELSEGEGRIWARHSSKVKYRQHAAERVRAEREAGGDPPRFIVFGHTHKPEVVPIDLDPPNSWVYINTGTWREVHQRCVGEPERIEFLSFHVMSIAAIYADDERGGRPYETWTGTLGLRP